MRGKLKTSADGADDDEREKGRSKATVCAVYMCTKDDDTTKRKTKEWKK